MKKTIMLLLCLALSLCLCIVAFADDAAIITCTADVTQVNRGGQVVVTVSLAECADVATGGLEVNYNTDIFELVEGAWVGKVAENCDNNDSFSFMRFDVTSGQAVFAFFENVPVVVAEDINGEIFSFTLQVKDDADFAETEISVTGSLKDAENKDISFTVTGTTVEIVCDHRNQSEFAPAVEPSCTQTGLTAGVQCDDCGAIVAAQEEVSVLPHDFDEWVVTTEANCEQDGERYRECKDCGEVETEVIPSTLCYGDVNHDGRINPSDARLVLKYYVGNEINGVFCPHCANVDGKRNVNPSDARLILQFYVGIIKEFPAAIKE